MQTVVFLLTQSAVAQNVDLSNKCVVAIVVARPRTRSRGPTHAYRRGEPGRKWLAMSVKWRPNSKSSLGIPSFRKPDTTYTGAK